MHHLDLCRNDGGKRVAVAIRQGINLFDRVVMGWLGGLSASSSLMVWYLSQCLTRAELEVFSVDRQSASLLHHHRLSEVGGMRQKG